MQFAFHLHALRHHWRAKAPSRDEQETSFQTISKHGFEGVDISDSWPIQQMSRHSAMETRALAQAHGLVIPTISCMGKTLCHRELGEQNQQAVEAVLDVASWLGATVVNIALSIPREPGGTPVMGARHSPGGSLQALDSDFETTANRLREIAAKAATRGLSLAVELHDRSLADTSSSLLRILDEVSQPNVGANPDLCNGYRAYEQAPEPWQDALKALAPRTNLWHVNNMQRVHFSEISRAAFVERAIPEGDVDYSLALSQIQCAGFDGWTVVEYKGLGDPVPTVAKGRAYLASLLEARKSLSVAAVDRH